jgi:hypothetical protein
VTSEEQEVAGSEHALAPARTPRTRDRRPAAPEYDDADVQRGLAAAVLGSLGRIQLRLDALAREQSEAFAELLTSVSDLERRLAVIEAIAQGAEEEPGAHPQ